MKPEINKNILLTRIDKLASEKNMTRTAVFQASGVGKNFKSNLTIAQPSLGKLTQLANFFDVSVEYLTGQTDERAKTEPTTAKDPQLPDILYRVLDLSDEKQKEVFAFIEFKEMQQKNEQP